MYFAKLIGIGRNSGALPTVYVFDTHGAMRRFVSRGPRSPDRYALETATRGEFTADEVAGARGPSD